MAKSWKIGPTPHLKLISNVYATKRFGYWKHLFTPNSQYYHFKVILRDESGQNLNLVKHTLYDGRGHVKSV